MLRPAVGRPFLFRFRFRPCAVRKEGTTRNVHRQPVAGNKATGGKGNETGRTGTRGGGEGGLPHFVDSCGLRGTLNSPLCKLILHGAYYSRLTPFPPFVPPSLPVGASFLAPPFRFLRVPRVVSGTFLRLEVVKNCQNGKIFPFLVRRCTSLFRSECSKRCTFRGPP